MDPISLTVLNRLGFAVLERIGTSRTFRLLGERPAWWDQAFGADTALSVDLDRLSPFLLHFYPEAATAWETGSAATANSGAWTHRGQDTALLQFEATALSCGARRLLLLERIDARFEQTRRVLQQARDEQLRHGRTVKQHEAVERHLTGTLNVTKRERDDVTALLQHLHLAAFVIDGSGRISYATPRSLDWINSSPSAVMGQPWHEALPLSPEDRNVLQSRWKDDRESSLKPPLRLLGDQPRWVDYELHHDPRNTGGRILLLHDRTDVQNLRQQLDQKAHFHDLIGRSPVMLQIYQLLRDVARVDTTVLIEGETGTGKELIARAIHFASPRKDRPFIAANCAGLTDSLLGSQLFGHKRGAFTGAIADHRGLFEAAEGGTLFLDEIGDVPSSVQTSLLRALQEKEITRLGETKPRKVNVRILAATHHNLNEDVVRGTFRADLLYRIRVARIHLPPLRDRRDDIPLLALSFLGHVCAVTGKTVTEIHPDSLRLLMKHDWPGNVRELKSAIEFAIIGCRSDTLLPGDLPPEIRQTGRPSHPTPIFTVPDHDSREYLLAALKQTQGNRTAAAKLLGISRATFYRRLLDHRIDPDA
ncbi:MAG: sigma 54-interacting transcriptional regulator [Nitrospira sp.]